jgi:hypothetical protein
MTETIFFWILNLTHWNLFVMWCLGLVAYLNYKLKIISSYIPKYAAFTSGLSINSFPVPESTGIPFSIT